MSDKSISIGVKAIITDITNSKFLVIIRKQCENLSFSEKYDIPGGRINFGEEPLEGLKREIDEEIGYRIKSKPILLDAENIQLTGNNQIIRLTYLLKEGIDLSKVILGNEHSQADMLPLAENPGFHPLLNQAINICNEYFLGVKEHETNS